MKFSRRLASSAVILAFLFSLSPAAEKLSPDLEKALNSIRPMDVYDSCKTISSPRFAWADRD